MLFTIRTPAADESSPAGPDVLPRPSRAERKDLVARVRDSCDRRAFQVILTERGREVAAPFYDHVAACVGSLAEDLDPGDRGGLMSAAERVLGGQPATTIFAHILEESLCDAQDEVHPA
jgi:DNA-binding MarR family transcriptional regulator